MSSLKMRAGQKYYLIPNYTMKCRLYPNRETAKAIDDAIYGIQVFHNCTLYEMSHNLFCTIEKESKNKEKEVIVKITRYAIFDIVTDQIIDDANGFYYTKKGRANRVIKHHGYKNAEVRPITIEKVYENKLDTVHFADFKAIGSVEWKKRMILEHPIISKTPSSAITCKSGIIDDIKKSLGKNPIEFNELTYYSKRNQRTSYTYQEHFSKVKFSDNRKSFFMDLAKVGKVKVRGWNQDIRFDENGEVDFLTYVKLNPKKQVTVTISRDNCGDYWICFKLANVYKLFNSNATKIVGVDVGITDIAILQDGTKFENKKYKEQQQDHLNKLHAQLSNRQGWANEEFRDQHRKNQNLKPSKSYEKTRLKIAKVERNIARKRELWNHQITRTIVESSKSIAIETLNVHGMWRNINLSNALADASIGDIHAKLSYKALWYNRNLKKISPFAPSSKRCFCCGSIYDELTLSMRDWVCSHCGDHHDRDINAAKNIRYYAFEQG